jgi:hypothetical protein
MIRSAPLFCLLTCSAAGHAADSAALLDAAAGITIHGTEYGPVTLSEGVWEGEPWVEGGASRPRVGLASDFLRRGDVDSDGQDELLVVVWQSSGGSGTYNYIALLDENGGTLRNTATTALGDRVKVMEGAVSPGLVEVEVLEHDEDDAACCPTRHAVRRFDADLQPLDTPDRKPE